MIATHYGATVSRFQGVGKSEMFLDFVERCDVDRLNEVFKLGDFFFKEVCANLKT